MSSVYMYHAVGDISQIVGADPHYAVSEANFASQIKIINTSISLAEQIKQRNQVFENCITFDDGHLSNYTVAFPLLKAMNLAAEFYINTAYVGSENYMSWKQLKEMADAGMSIQSHSHNHFYISTLSDDEVRFELETSKRLIESHLKTQVTVFAPPGGRIDKRVERIAFQLGYCCIATSKPGIVSNSTEFTIPRFAVLASSRDKHISDWLHQWSFSTFKERIRFFVFNLLKKILGNGSYEKVREFVLSIIKSVK